MVVGSMSCASGMPMQARAPAPKGSVLLTCPVTQPPQMMLLLCNRCKTYGV